MSAKVRRPATDGRELGRLLVRRFAWAMAAVIVLIVLTLLLGVPNECAKPVTMGIAMTIAFTGVWPRQVPNYRLKNAILWGAHFAYFAGAWVLMEWWRGG